MPTCNRYDDCICQCQVDAHTGEALAGAQMAFGKPCGFVGSKRSLHSFRSHDTGGLARLSW